MPALCDYFLDKYAGRYCRNERLELPTRLRETFCSYRWPGNVRQLENTIKQFLILREEELVLQSLLYPPMETQPEQPLASPLPPEQQVHSLKSELHSLKAVGAEVAERAEREIVLRTLNKKQWNRKQAARELGISYKTLLNKLHRWDKVAG